VPDTEIPKSIFLQVLFRKWYGTLVLRWQPRLWLQILRENLPVGAAMLLGQSTVNLPPLVLGALAGSLAVGTFTAALKLAIVFLIVDRVLNALLLPVMTRYLTTQGNEAAFVIRVVLKVTVAVILPLTLAGVLMASWIVGFVFGPGYEASTLPLQILMGYVGMTILNSVFVSILLGEGRTKSYLSISFAGAAFMVALLLVLAPLAGPVGAAAAMAVGEAVLVLLVARSAAARGLPGLAGFIRLLVAGGGMVIAGWALSFAGPFVSTIAAMAAYLLLLFLLRAFVGDEIAFLRERFV
jgi:O-antigen/teichoic acid export membrane protein